MENLPQPENDRPVDVAASTDNSAHDEFENVANPMRPGDESENPGQNGRNLRGFGSTDQDGANGILRMNDQDNSTMEVTPEAENSITAPGESTNTSTVAVTTAGPDDDASADETPVPDAEKAAKEAATDAASDTSELEGEKDDEIARTGTDLDFQPAA